jgi:hypothetical protein
MSISQNVYLPVDPLWAYNFIGAVEEHGLLETDQIRVCLSHAMQYLQVRHNFISGAQRGQNDPVTFNNAMQTLQKKASFLGEVPFATFQYYWEALYRSLRVPLSHLPYPIIDTHVVADENADLKGTVVEVRLQ